MSSGERMWLTIPVALALLVAGCTPSVETATAPSHPARATAESNPGAVPRVEPVGGGPSLSGRWRVSRAWDNEGVFVDGPSVFTVTFLGLDRATGFDGCNWFTGTVTSEGTRRGPFVLHARSTTLRACPAELATGEGARFAGAMNDVESYYFNDRMLVLAGHGTTIHFEHVGLIPG